MLNDLIQLFRSYPWYTVVIELGVIWLGVYYFFRAFKGTRGAPVIQGVAVFLILLTLLVRMMSRQTDAFARLTFLYDRLLLVVVLALIVIFQPELRQALIRLSHLRPFRSAAELGMDQVADALTEAATFLSKNQFGAIIAIERAVRLNTLVEAGQWIDAEVSARLLETLFWPNCPLHDLGVVIRGNRILAAGVQFPLAEEGTLPPSTGSRHRAALGLVTETDALVVIISEETGTVSLAENGAIDFDIPRNELRAVIGERLSAPPKPMASAEEHAEEHEAPRRITEQKDEKYVA
ncbi:MAG TPA: diadenylate cyclase [Phycisphaerales bacterium]|nr:diadenylate cyclase [Phycisphaerales bacterium]